MLFSASFACGTSGRAVLPVLFEELIFHSPPPSGFNAIVALGTENTLPIVFMESLKK
jgi:hypothetical protein